MREKSEKGKDDVVVLFVSVKSKMILVLAPPGIIPGQLTAPWQLITGEMSRDGLPNLDS